ncbi:MAG TPA: SAM-dependent methyltransferase [Candidatus Acidoferrales bacterium]|nr:SAM-dependent methyltransferase [Candidatus Acidoferrales bacterium]
MSAERTPLAELLLERIRASGPLTFSDFMEACLYHPEHGYYSRPEPRRFADYYTSPDVHPVFGRLLARQLAEMWERLGRPAEFLAVEGGAGGGRLAAQILDFAEHALPEFFGALRYVAVEACAARRQAQGQAIGRHLNSGRATSRASLPERIPAGCVFSNELLDALPVDRVVGGPDGLKEIQVGERNGWFADVVAAAPAPRVAAYFARQGVRFAEGQEAEAALAACDWIVEAGRRLERGFVLTIDYGHEAPELYNARHMRGTLLAYRDHRVSEEYYAAPGLQDLTAHVSFTALDLWGHDGGLERTGLASQTRFLLSLGRANEFADVYDEGQTEMQRLRARLLWKTLIYPEGMGETFRVFIQHKGVDGTRLTGLAEL